MINLTIDVKPRGIVSAYVEAPFDKAKKALEKEAYKIISLEQNAQLSMQEGKDSFISRNGNCTREGVIYVPKKGIFLTKNSPIMVNPKEATECQRNGKEFYLNKEQVEKALADSVELSGKPIPTSRFNDDKITVFAFGNTAKEYGEFLKEAGINEMPIYVANVKKNPFVRQMWPLGLGGRSVLIGSSRSLCYGSRVRGVREGAEGVVKNLYSKEQIATALKQTNLSGIESILFRKLEK
jgi:hypothetical protein